MKRISILVFTLLIVLSSTALAFQLKSTKFSVAFSNIDEVSTITHDAESWLTAKYKNGDSITYHYLDRSDSFAKFYYIPEKVDEHDDGFLDAWVKNVGNSDHGKGKILCVETMPDKNGIYYVKQFDNGNIFALGEYILDGKVYTVSKSSKNSSCELASRDIRKLINTIYPR